MGNFSKRKKLMCLYSAGGFALVCAIVLGIHLSAPAKTTYRPGADVEGIVRSLDRPAAPVSEEGSASEGQAEAAPGSPAAGPKPLFTEVSAQAGINFTHFHGTRSSQLPEDMGSGAAWGDYDNDGDDDLYVCNIAGPLTATAAEIQSSPASNRLYRNDGKGRFEDVTMESGVGFKGLSMAASWADYDADGDVDLFVSNYGGLKLYRNDRGRFVDVTRAAGLASANGFWTGASWADYDRDGDLDVYVCGYVKYHYDPQDAAKMSRQYEASIPFTLNPSSYTPESNLLFRNDGKGGFTEVAERAGVADPKGRGLSAAWCDFDLDGWLDLYVANDVSDNAMYRNLGNGTFEDISEKSWVADYRGAMGLAIGDWDGDTDFDIYVTHWIAQENALFSNMTYSSWNLAQKSPQLMFMDIADEVGLGQISLDYVCWGTSFVDFDNDGRPDLFVANGSTFEREENRRKLVPMRNLLFRNQGELKGFFEVGSATPAIGQSARVGRGAAFADYDQDGDTDIFVVNHGERAFLLRNERGQENRWLRIRLAGRKANRQAIGALVLLKAGERRQSQQIGSQSSYLSQNSSDALFGVGKAAKVDEVVVKFPSGKSVSFKDVKTNQTLLVEEDPS